jgi:hypothetical protein
MTASYGRGSEAMTVLFDNGVPKPIAKFLTGHAILALRASDWLARAQERRID